MPMGIVSDKDFESALIDSGAITPPTPEKTIQKPEIVEIERGRGKNNPNVPNTLRNIIGEESAVNGRDSALELARQFGISPASVSAYNKGATSCATYDERPNLPKINEAKERVSKRARNKLMMALSKITDTKLEVTSARDLAGIAKDMSAIVKTMEPETPVVPTQQNNGPTFVFYSPQLKREEQYDIVHVKE